jgi:hypothetical protein
VGVAVRYVCWRLVELVALALEPAEREAVLGDVAEHGNRFGALRDVVGIVVRRQANLWMTWRPWAVTALLVLPSAFLLAFDSSNTAGSSSVTLWLYLNNWDWNLVSLPAFQHDFPRFLLGILSSYLALFCWSWVSGLLVGRASQRAVASTGALFCAVTAFVQLLGPQVIFRVRALDYRPNGPVFALPFYSVALPLIVCALLVFLPAIAGMRQGVRLRQFAAFRRRTLGILAVVSCALLAVQLLFVYRAILRFLLPGLPVPIFSWPFQLHFLVYWPVFYWLASAVQRRRVQVA